MKMASFADRIEAARDDAAELGRIADELQGVPGSDMARLRLRAISFRMAVKTKDSGSVIRAVPTPPWLADLGLPQRNGRPLHRYRLSDDAFRRLEQGLRAQKRALRFDPDPVLAARFVLWAAEWFRRRYDGTGRRWEALGAALGLEADWAEWQRLADMGLKHWSIPELRIRGKHYRLAAIARQGGFPVAALEGQGAGWAPRFLGRLVGLLLGETDATLDAADAVAAGLMDMIPETWRSEEMRLVSAELAVEIVKLRRDVTNAGLADGALASAWLDANRKGWRDELSINISSETGRALVDGLMKTAALKGGGGAVRVERRLLLMTDGRRERVELMLTGELRDEHGRAIDHRLGNEWNRLRLVPSGLFAQHAGGELATAEPGDGGFWLARSLLTKVSFDLPAEVSVTAELRGGGQRVGEPFILPGGDAIKAAVRVYVAVDSLELNEGSEIALVGTGSGGYRPEKLLLDLNSDWTCAAHGEGSECLSVALGRTDKRGLWEVAGAAIAVSPLGDRYLIRTGQKGNLRDRLILMGRQAKGFQYFDATLPTFLGPPVPRFSEGGRDRAARSGEFWWRRKGFREWRIDASAAGPGLCEFAWRDARTGHIRSGAEALILPAGFTVVQSRNGDWLDFVVTEWPGHVEVEGGAKYGETVWRFPARESSRSSCHIRLLGVSDPIVLSAPLPHVSWIFDWTGTPLARKGPISLSTINQFVARTDGRCQLFAELLDYNRRPIAQGRTSWWIDDELPLSSVRNDLAALLRPQGNLDAIVKLSFNDGTSQFWLVSEFDHELKREGIGWLPTHAVVNGATRIAGRQVLSPTKEVDFGEYSLEANHHHRPFLLPRLEGDWIVYLRNPDRVLSRPRFIHGNDIADLSATSLIQAMLIADLDERRAALRTLINSCIADSEKGRSLVRQIIELACSLNGLPPSTFDILLLLSEAPLLSAMLLFQASSDEIEPLMQLSEGLPLEWCLISARDWNEAAREQLEYILSKVPDQLALAADHISNRRKTIAQHEPALAGLLGLKGERNLLADVANAFLNRSDDEIEELQNPFRPRRDALLPRWKVDEAFWRALDAPVMAALAARELVTLDPQEIMCVKNINRRHPRWFREAFHAALLE